MNSTQSAANAHHHRHRHDHDRDRQPVLSIPIFLFAGLALTIVAFLTAIDRAPSYADMQRATRADAAIPGIPMAAPARR